VYDAYAGPLPPPVPKSKRGPADEEENSEAGTTSTSDSQGGR
jgi:hypothetical protein